MDWSRPIDAYCERLGPGLLAEPLNAATNIAFLIAAWLAWADLRRTGRPDAPAMALVAVIAVIGVGSGLFHTFANVWSSLADVLPIAVFVHGYLLLALRRFFSLGWPAAIALIAVFVGLEMLATPLLGSLIGASAGYVPPLAALAATAAVLSARDHPAAARIGLAALVFAVSLALRTADEPVCATFPIGTHLFWHLLNAVTLWLIATAAIRHPRG